MSDQSAIDRMVSSLHWLGHDTFRLDTDQGPVFFDPFEIETKAQARLILASHDHFDHCVAEVISQLQGPDTAVITEPQCAGKLNGDVRVMKPGEVMEVGGLTVKAVPAYNTDKEFHPKENAWLGFIVTIDGVSIYHAGDTDFIPEMEGLKPDIALLPVSGTYVMTAQQAVEAAKAIQPKLAIPMHYGAIVGDENDAKAFAQALEGVVPVKVLEKE